MFPSTLQILNEWTIFYLLLSVTKVILLPKPNQRPNLETWLFKTQCKTSRHCCYTETAQQQCFCCFLALSKQYRWKAKPPRAQILLRGHIRWATAVKVARHLIRRQATHSLTCSCPKAVIWIPSTFMSSSTCLEHQESATVPSLQPEVFRDFSFFSYLQKTNTNYCRCRSKLSHVLISAWWAGCGWGMTFRSVLWPLVSTVGWNQLSSLIIF